MEKRMIIEVLSSGQGHLVQIQPSPSTLFPSEAVPLAGRTESLRAVSSLLSHTIRHPHRGPTSPDQQRWVWSWFPATH